MRFSLLIRGAACAFLAVLLCVPALASQAKPITYKGLLNSLKTRGLSNAELAEIIKSRGVDFDLTAEKESELKAAGADAALLSAVRANYRAPSSSDKSQPSETQPPSSQPPSSQPPAAASPETPPSTATKPSTSPDTPVIKSIRDVKKLYIEKMSNDLDELIKSEISRQMPNRLLVVLRPEDADAIMKGGSSNHHGNVSITDLRGTAELWVGEAGDKGIHLTKIHGGEKKVAERLVSSLKKALE